jgi:hypothetical protein
MDNISKTENVTDDNSGYIYIIKPERFDGIKIGKTMRTMTETHSRYVTAYTGKMTITMYKSDNRHYHEKKIHWLLYDDHIDGEVFNVSSYDKAKNICATICGNEGTEKTYAMIGRKPKDPACIVDEVSEKRKKKQKKQDRLAKIQEDLFYKYPHDEILNSDDHIVKKTLLDIYGTYRNDVNFLKLYYNKNVIDIYKNLRRHICSNNDVQVVSDIRCDIAMKMLEICGFDGILDTKEIKRGDIFKNIIAGKDYIDTNGATIGLYFNKKREPADWNVLKSLLEYINGITSVMYGCKVMAKSKSETGKNLFMIKH